MRGTLREIEVPHSPTTRRHRPLFTITRLAQLSGIPHVQKLKVAPESLVDLMVGMQFNAEQERRLLEERIILYDPHYLSGLVELPSPTHSVQDTRPTAKWPLVSPKGRKQRTLKILERVPEEPELGRSVETGPGQNDDYLISSQLIYESSNDEASQISPRQFSSKEASLKEQAASAAIGQSWTNLAESFPDVPCTSSILPAMTDDTTASERSISDGSVASDAAVSFVRDRRRAHSESSIDTHLAQKHKPSLHLYSPWMEELDNSFGLKERLTSDGMLGTRGPLDAQQLELYGKPANWGNTPISTRNQSLASQKGSLGRYRTTHIASAIL